MKILIWCCCMFVYAVITAFLKAGGITLGGIPTILLLLPFFAIATSLCKKWDTHEQNRKNAIEEQQPEDFDFDEDYDTEDSTLS